MVETIDEKIRKSLMVTEYYNNDNVSKDYIPEQRKNHKKSYQEMPHIPDVGILHCGELPHHRMGIKVK